MKSIKNRKENRTACKRNCKHKKTIKLKRKTHKKSKTEKNKKQTGGDTPMPKIVKHVNFFREVDKLNYNDIEQYLNPIYGVIMCESGYIENNYYIAKQRIDNESKRKQVIQPGARAEEKKESGDSQLEEEESDMSLTPEMKVIEAISTVVPPNVKPTKDIIQFIDPHTIGSFIAALYFYRKINDRSIYEFLILKIKKRLVRDQDFSRAFAVLTNNFTPKESQEMSKEMFHILLYCLWWVSNNMDGIKQYYAGINYTFEQLNTEITLKKTKIFREKQIKIFPIVSIKEQAKQEEKKGESVDLEPPKKKSFESIVGEIVFKSFKILEYSPSAKSFNSESKRPYYSDCVETTARNFINLLLFDGVNFNIDAFSKERDVNEHTIQYYRAFNSFDSQLSNEEKDIYGLSLNAVDAWSYLIIHHANTKISFKEHDAYEVFSGVMIKDGTKTNFIQLLQNLLSPNIINPRTIKDDLSILNPSINSVQDEQDAFNQGVGVILIDYEMYNIKVDISKSDKFFTGHSTIEIKNKYTISNPLKEDNEESKYIDYLLFNDDVTITSENYLWFKYTKDSIVIEYMKSYREKKYDLLFKFLEILMSDFSNTEVRSRIFIRIDALKDHHLKYINNTKHLDDFNAFSSDDFKFFDIMTNLKSNSIKRHYFSNPAITELPDLTPLVRLTSIWDDFVLELESLTRIDLSKLTNLVSIGNNFAKNCNGLKTIILNPLQKLESIGHGFAYGCKYHLQEITLHGNPKLKEIGDMFACDCINLNTIKLINLPELKTIGNKFAFSCDKLTSIGLVNLKELSTIGDNFARYSESVKTLLLSNVPKLKGINYIRSEPEEEEKVEEEEKEEEEEKVEEEKEEEGLIEPELLDMGEMEEEEEVFSQQ